MASRSASSLSVALACAALLFGASCFVAPPSTNLRATAVAGAVALAPLPALAGGPPSVGDHWYWDLGFGSLHGETATIILMNFFLLVVFSVLGAGGSSKKSSA